MRPRLQLFTIPQHWRQDCHRGCRHCRWSGHFRRYCLRALPTPPPGQRTAGPCTRSQILNSDPYQTSLKDNFLLYHELYELDMTCHPRTQSQGQYQCTGIVIFCIPFSTSIIHHIYPAGRPSRTRYHARFRAMRASGWFA